MKGSDQHEIYRQTSFYPICQITCKHPPTPLAYLLQSAASLPVKFSAACGIAMHQELSAAFNTQVRGAQRCEGSHWLYMQSFIHAWDRHMTHTPCPAAILLQRRTKAGMLSPPLKLFTALKVWTQFSFEWGASMAGLAPTGSSSGISGRVESTIRSALQYLTRWLVAGTCCGSLQPVKKHCSVSSVNHSAPSSPLPALLATGSGW